MCQERQLERRMQKKNEKKSQNRIKIKMMKQMKSMRRKLRDRVLYYSFPLFLRRTGIINRIEFVMHYLRRMSVPYRGLLSMPPDRPGSARPARQLDERDWPTLSFKKSMCTNHQTPSKHT